MIIPVRCFTCGKVIGNLWNQYIVLKKEKSIEEALDDLAKMLWELGGKKGTLEEAEKDCKTALGIARKEIKDDFGVKFG